MLPIPKDHSFSMRVRVTPEMIARFFDCTMHRVYATFVLVEHAEYAARMAIRSFLEEHEDAVGSAVRFEHLAPTPVGWIVEITATVTAVEGRRIDCAVVATNRNGEIARGVVEQRVVARERLAAMLDALERDGGTE
jgi:fluoroacetyl-CoA thioesterase